MKNVAAYNLISEFRSMGMFSHREAILHCSTEHAMYFDRIRLSYFLTDQF